MTNSAEMQTLIDIYNKCDKDSSTDDSTSSGYSHDLKEAILNLAPVRSITEELDTILNTIHDDILITDGSGTIVRVSPSFESKYDVHGGEIVGRNVLELEREGVFRPSVTAIVLKKGSQITMLQENNEGRKIIVTATPVKNDHGDIIKVISFSRDLTDFLNLKAQYEDLEERMQKYTAEITELREKQRNMTDIIGSSKCIESIFEIIDKVARFDANVLIEGESGVGKSMFAKLIHAKSLRNQGPMIEINCGSIPENLLESELFGYEKGAFTGASTAGKIGLIELADKGTLFLDEIGELPLALQTKLLKVIQDKKLIRIGATKEIDVDFRLIAATNRKLKESVEKGSFREDLYYRLNVIFLSIPPLRERGDDVFKLIRHFLKVYNEKYGFRKSIAPEAINALVRFSWPGNIRELENIIERIILTADDDMIALEDLPENIRKNNEAGPLHFTSLKDALDQTERKIIKEAYSKHKTTTGVARELGISQPTAVRKIFKYIGKGVALDE